MRTLLLCLSVLLALSACKTKAALTGDDERYIEQTLAIERTKVRFFSNSDSVLVRRALDSVYKLHEIDTARYLEHTRDLAENEQRALLVFAAIKDSLTRPSDTAKPMPRAR